MKTRYDWIGIVLALPFWLTHLGNATANYGVGDCCRRGEMTAEAVVERISQRNLTFVDAVHFCETVAESDVCEFVQRSCCINFFRTAACLDGMRSFSEKNECRLQGHIYAYPLDHLQIIRLECCSCCYLQSQGVSLNVLSWCQSTNISCALQTAPQDDEKDEPSTPDDPNTITEMPTDVSQDNFTEVLENNETATASLPNSKQQEEEQQAPTPPTNLWTNPLFTTTAAPVDTSKYSRNSASTSASAPPSSSTHGTTTLERVDPEQILCGNDFKWNPTMKLCVRTIVSCPLGYTMSAVERQCIRQKQPLQECQKGYKRDALTGNCTDIDECRLQEGQLCNQSGQVCFNKAGGYDCRCQSGFMLARDKSCIDVDECKLSSSSPCALGQKCKNVIGSYECVREVPCGFGYVLDSKSQECLDIDECKTDPDICGPGMQCTNIRGGHKCREKECPTGQKRNSRGACSYCGSGYYYKELTKQCIDIDECTSTGLLNKGGCKSYETCVNLPGTYSCKPKMLCRRGTRINANGTNCNDINECLTQRYQCKPNQICINTHGSYYCVASPCGSNQMFDYNNQSCTCKDGFRPGYRNECEDIDECEEKGSEQLCGKNLQCYNIPGSYNCYVRSACPRGMFRPSIYSHCEDVNECETKEAKCGANMYCKNSVGSYQCLCNHGFRPHKDQCVDIDECQLFRPDESCPDLHAQCINTPGSYSCVCPQGFVWTTYPKRKCEDIDECEKQANICGANHKCVNSIGSYSCRCAPGYRLAENQKTCIDIDECALSRSPCANALCVNLPGTFNCLCPKGYRLGRGNKCVDIDECKESQGICASSHFEIPSQACLNLAGTYKCIINVCPQYYTKQRQGDGFRCILDNKHHCPLGDNECLRNRPYQAEYKFIEIMNSPSMTIPQVLTRIGLSFLPPGIQRIQLKQQYSFNSNTKEAIDVTRSLRMRKSRVERNSIEIQLQKQIPAPADIMVEFQVDVTHGQRYFGHAVTRLFIYVTNY